MQRTLDPAREERCLVRGNCSVRKDVRVYALEGKQTVIRAPHDRRATLEYSMCHVAAG